MASLFDRNPKLNKPQVKNYLNSEDKTIKKVAEILRDKGLSAPDAITIAKHVVPLVIKEKIDAVHPTAASVDLPMAQVINSVLMATEIKLDQMDANGELEAILESAALAEQKAKYDF